MLAAWCKYLISTILIGIRPLLGPASCKYTVGCTQFALDQLKEQPLLTALPLITKRVLSCNPLSSVGNYE